jgi:hypothetical protein
LIFKNLKNNIQGLLWSFLFSVESILNQWNQRIWSCKINGTAKAQHSEIRESKFDLNICGFFTDSDRICRLSILENKSIKRF